MEGCMFCERVTTAHEEIGKKEICEHCIKDLLKILDKYKNKLE